MLEYTKAGDGAWLSTIVLHDDAEREYAYGPAQGLPNTKVGTFTQALYDLIRVRAEGRNILLQPWQRCPLVYEATVCGARRRQPQSKGRNWRSSQVDGPISTSVCTNQSSNTA
jgi:hypothetical protein